MKLLGLLAFIAVVGLLERSGRCQDDEDIKLSMLRNLQLQVDAGKTKAKDIRERQAKGLAKTSLREIVDEIEKITKSAENNILNARSTADKQDAFDKAEAEFLEYLTSQEGRSLDVRVVIKDNIKDKSPLSSESSLLVTSKLPTELSEFRITGKTIHCDNELQFHTSTTNQKKLEPKRTVILRGDFYVIREGETMEIGDDVPIHLFSHSVHSILSSKVRNPNIHYSQKLEARLANVQFLISEDGEEKEKVDRVAELDQKEKMDPPEKKTPAVQPKTTSIKSIVTQLDRLTRATVRDVTNAKSSAEKEQELEKHEQEIVDFLTSEDGKFVEFSVTVKDIAKPKNADRDVAFLFLITSSSKDLAEFYGVNRPLSADKYLQFKVPEDDLQRFQIGTTITVKGELVVSEGGRLSQRLVKEPLKLFGFSLVSVLDSSRSGIRDWSFRYVTISLTNPEFITPKDRKLEIQKAGEAEKKNP